MIAIGGWWTLPCLIACAAVGALLESATGSRAAGYFIAGLALTAFAWWLHYQDPDRRDTLFWIPLRFWGPAIAIGALAGL